MTSASTGKASDTSWRVVYGDEQASHKIQDTGILDEVVLGKWLHLEHMGGTTWWMQLGDARVDVEVREDGSAEINITRGWYGNVDGQTEIHKPEE